MCACDVSIVIVSYNVKPRLLQCLASLREATERVSAEIWVVDNASADDSVDTVKEQFPKVHLIANSDNRGFAAANNQALEHAQGRYALLLNPDTVMKPNALETLVYFMEGHSRAGACGAKLLYPDGSLQHSAFHFPTLAQIFLDLFPTHWRLAESRLNGRYPRGWYERDQPFSIDHPLGACLLVRGEATRQVGLLDPDFFIYAEEIDWCIRLKRAGWQVWCVPSAEVIHWEAQSTRQFRQKMFVELWRARLRLFQKHYSRAFNAAARWIIALGMRRAEASAESSFKRGEIGEDELNRRREGYETVLHWVRGNSRE